MAGLTARRPAAPRLGHPRGARGADLGWPILVRRARALVLALWLLTVSLAGGMSRSCSWLLVVGAAPVRPALGDRRDVRALVPRARAAPRARAHDRLRGQRPAVARARSSPRRRSPALELVQCTCPAASAGSCSWRPRASRSACRPASLVGPRAAVYACVAYSPGSRRRARLQRARDVAAQDSTLRRVLLYGMPPIAAYAIAQRVAAAAELGPVVARRRRLQQHRRADATTRSGCSPRSTARARWRRCWPLAALLPDGPAAAPVRWRWSARRC